MGQEQIGEEQEMSTMPNDPIMLESSSRQGKRVKVDQVSEDMSLSGMDHLIQYIEGRFNVMELFTQTRFNAMEISYKARFDAMELSHKARFDTIVEPQLAMNRVIKDM